MLLYPRLAAAVAERDLTYADVADAVGCTKAAISGIARGTLRPSPALKSRISNALGVPVGELFVLTPEMAGLVELARSRGLIDDPVILRKAVS